MRTYKNETNRLNLQLLFTILLRVFIGCHFFYEGVAKLFNPNWSAQYYLESSQWLFSDLFHSMASNPSVLEIVNFLNIWGLILIGLGLMFGMFIRIASLSGVFLLLLYYLANPPFMTSDGIKEGNYLIIDKNMVEMIGLCLLAVLPLHSLINFNQIKDFIKAKFLTVKSDEANEVQKYPCEDEKEGKRKLSGRRAFLLNLGLLPLSGLYAFTGIKKVSFLEKTSDAFSSATALQIPSSTSLKDLKGKLPFAKIGNVEISRMFIGCNLIGGWTHGRDLIYLSNFVKQYYTKKKIFETLLLAEECGINTIIQNTSLIPLMNAYWKEAKGKMQFIADCAGGTDIEREKVIKASIDAGASACYIQGAVGDRMLRKNQSFEIFGEWMEKIRSYGVPAGIGAHSIGSIRKCVELGIKPDFWVKTLHQTNYKSGHPGEIYDENVIFDPRYYDNRWCNPEETIQYMATLEEPWIAFKVLAAGAILPEEGFRYAFENGADIICVGIYDFQIVEDVNIANKILSEKLNRQRSWKC